MSDTLQLFVAFVGAPVAMTGIAYIIQVLKKW